MSSFSSPAASPPAAYTVNMQDPTIKGLAAGWWVTIIGTVLATFLQALRIYTKAVLVKMFGWEDALMLLARVFSLAVQGLLLCTCDGLVRFLKSV
jgi:uncharacterized integral membrane protein